MTQEDFDLLNQKYKVITYNPESKKLCTNAIKDYFVQGENKTSAVLIVGPPKIKAISLLELRMAIRVSSQEFETTVEKTLETQQLDDENIGMLWEVGKEETAVPGNLSVSLIGYGGSEEVIKITSDGIVVKADDLEEQAPPESTWNQILSQVQSFAAQAAQSKNAAKESEQIATEKAAEATASAATAAQKATEAISAAATAAEEAATLAAAETEEKIRGFADDRYARALVTTEGSAESLTIYPDEGSSIAITSHGYTEQSGSGDPSPKNVRPIKIGGLKLIEKVLDGKEDWKKSTGVSGNAYYLLVSQVKRNGIVYSKYAKNATESEVFSSKEWKISLGAGYDYIRLSSPLESVLELKQFLSENPLLCWYEPTEKSQATGIYVPQISEGEKYDCHCIKIQKHLCEGDTLNGNTKYQNEQKCVEKHIQEFYTFTGEETATVVFPELGLIRIEIPSSPQSYKQFICTEFKYVSNTGPGGAYIDNMQLYVNPTGGQFDSLGIAVENAVDGWKAYLAERYSSGNPVQIAYPVTTPIIYTQTAIRMEADPKAADGSVKVKGEKTISATYNKSLKKAIEELKAAMLALGSNLSM